jgi:hypothetical protein
MLSHALSRLGEFRGEYVRLDWDGIDASIVPTQMERPQHKVHELAECLCWHVSRSYRFAQNSHVNIQETRAIKAELKDRALKDPEPARCLNLIDSRVSLGAWGKGRSSSRQLGYVLRSCIPYSVAGQKHLVNLWIGTKFNPADDPTRHVPIRKPGPAPPWLKPFYSSNPDDAFDIHTPSKYKSSAVGRLSVKSLEASIVESSAVSPLSLSVSVPCLDTPAAAATSTAWAWEPDGIFIEKAKENSNDSNQKLPLWDKSEGAQHSMYDANIAHPTRQSTQTIAPPPGLEHVKGISQGNQSAGAYARCRRRRVFREIFAGVGHLALAFGALGWQVLESVEAYPGGKYDEEQDLSRPCVFRRLLGEAQRGWAFWHFGLPCKSFSRLNVNFNDGTRTRVNPWGDGSLAREVLGNLLLRLTLRLIAVLGSRGSWWSLENPTSSFVWSIPAVRRLRRRPGVHVVRFCQCMFGLKFPDSLPCEFCQKDTMIMSSMPLDTFARMCDGSHKHVHCQGGIKTRTGWQRRSVLAGIYPSRLCKAWAAEVDSDFSELFCV